MAQLPLDLVLEGGGVKGLGAVGAALRLLDEGYRIERVAGTSVGAIVGAFVAAGADGPRLRAIMSRLELNRIPDAGWPPVPFLGEALGLLLSSGLYRGDHLRRWMRAELEDLGVSTFGDLRRVDGGADPRVAPDRCYKFVAMATDITNGRLLRLPWDYERYGLVADDQLVCDAVRMSMSVPFLFRPCTLDNRSGVGPPATIVDGGVLSNFPVEVFDRTDGEAARWPTWGVRIMPTDAASLGPVLPLPVPRWLVPPQVRQAEQLLATMLVGQDQSHVERPDVACRTIAVDTDGIHVFNFDITEREREEAIARGWNDADAFLARQTYRPSPPD